MAQENQCYITGNLARDPEMKITQSGKPYCKFTLAASFKRGDKEYTEWVPVQVWGPLAESCGNYLQKGKRVTVRGKYSTSSWTDDSKTKKYYTQIIAEQVALVLPGAPFATSGNSQQEKDQSQGRGDFGQFGPTTPEYQQEEIPF